MRARSTRFWLAIIATSGLLSCGSPAESGGPLEFETGAYLSVGNASVERETFGGLVLTNRGTGDIFLRDITPLTREGEIEVQKVLVVGGDRENGFFDFDDRPAEEIAPNAVDAFSNPIPSDNFGVPGLPDGHELLIEFSNLTDDHLILTGWDIRYEADGREYVLEIREQWLVRCTPSTSVDACDSIGGGIESEWLSAVEAAQSAS